MGWYVHIHICFPCDHNDPVAQLAAKHLPGLAALEGEGGDGERAACWFLEAMTTRTGTNPGPKGGLSMWGIVGNYTRAEDFCEALKPFFGDLLRDGVGGICDHEHIIVFEEPEQSESATAYEIMLADDGLDATSKDIVVKKHAGLPFSWVQM